MAMSGTSDDEAMGAPDGARAESDSRPAPDTEAPSADAAAQSRGARSPETRPHATEGEKGLDGSDEPANFGVLTQPPPLPVADVDVLRRTMREHVEEWLPRLHAIRNEWEETLPPEAVALWTPGAAYIRKSCVMSLGREAPDTELRQVLAMLAQKVFVAPPSGLYFEVHSGGDVAKRAIFANMLESARAGGIKAIGVYLNERLFRNVEQASATKREFRVRGIELHYLGAYKGDPRNPAA
jgi:hypothetical protein